MIRTLTVLSIMVLVVFTYAGIRSQIRYYDNVHDQRIGSPPDIQEGWGREVNGVSTNAVLSNPKLLTHYRDPNGI